MTAVDADQSHIDIIASNMRAEDVEECAAWNLTPEQALRESLTASPFARTILLDGEPVGMFGIGADNPISTFGVPWMLGTDAMVTERRQFLFKGRPYMDLLATQYTSLSNYVPVTNTHAVQWLKWMGFTVEEPKAIGAPGAPDLLFHHFHVEF
jgi:hypothetical protein